MIKRFYKDEKGYAVVEATVLFPIMIMIFAALVMLSMYLPVRATLQRATQIATTAMAAEKSDTWLFYNENDMSYRFAAQKEELDNVYVALFNDVVQGDDDADRVETIVKNAEQNGISTTVGELTVEYGVINYVVYKELIVTATRTIPVAVDLSFIGFPTEIPVTVTSTAFVQNGDEFIRNMDIAVNLLDYFAEKYNFDDVFDKIAEFRGKFSTMLGWGEESHE
jgi:Flp pilus assembly protein TadG